MTTTDLAPVLSTEVERLLKGRSLTAVLKIIATREAEAPAIPERVPVPASITASQREAIARLSDVFGQVVPTKARLLTEPELVKLMDERLTLDVIAKMIETRKTELRCTLFNHFDKVAEKEGKHEGADRDGDGHYVLDGTVTVQELAQRFAREVRDGSVTMSPEALEALSKDENYPEFTHLDYLGMTTQTRVVDEVKVLAAVRKRPALLAIINQATTRGRKTASFWVRKP